MRIWALTASLLIAGSLHASPSEPSNPARIHFRAGLAAVEQGDLEVALHEFEAAYEKQPHYSVLYNIGQARLGLGQPLQAIEAFERYLREGSAQLSPERREEVRHLVEMTRRRVGELRLVLAAPESTRLWLDGVELDQNQWSQPISVVAGEHHVVFSIDGGSPISRTVSVSGVGSTELRIEGTRKPREPQIQVVIRCAVPGVRVDLPGMPTLTTPLNEPIWVTSSSIQARFSRAGYRAMERTVELDAAAPNAIDCGLRREPEFTRAARAGLIVRAVPSDAETFVDGEAFFGGALPAGPHTVTIQRDGFVPVTRTIALVSGKTQNYSIELERTAASRVRLAQSLHSRRTAGVALSGVGAALLLTAGSLFLWNNQRYRDWEAHQATASTGRNIDSAVSLQRLDDVCIGLSVLGAGLGAGGAWLLFSPSTGGEP